MQDSRAGEQQSRSGPWLRQHAGQHQCVACRLCCRAALHVHQIAGREHRNAPASTHGNAAQQKSRTGGTVAELLVATVCLPGGIAAAALAASRASYSCAICSLRSNRYVGTCRKPKTKLDLASMLHDACAQHAQRHNKLAHSCNANLHAAMSGMQATVPGPPAACHVTVTWPSQEHCVTKTLVMPDAKQLHRSHSLLCNIHTWPYSDLCRYCSAPPPAFASALTGLRAAAATAATLFSSTKSRAALQETQQQRRQERCVVIYVAFVSCLPLASQRGSYQSAWGSAFLRRPKWLC